jgi:hypothetical protein
MNKPEMKMETEFNFDLEQMKIAVNSKRVELNPVETFEEFDKMMQVDNKDTMIDNMFAKFTNSAKERSKRAFAGDGEVCYPFVVGYYESGMLDLLKRLDLSKAQMEILIAKFEL